MSKKFYWGLGVLILLLGTAFVFITVRDRADIRQLEEGLAEAKKLEKEMKQQPVAKTDSKPSDEPGFEWVRHNDHWDKVPVSAPNTWNTEIPNPVIETAKGMDQYIVRLSPTVRRIGGVLFDEDDTMIIDESFLGNPHQAIADIGEVILNRDRYTIQQFDEAVQKDSILRRKIRDRYYGEGSYGDRYEYMKMLLKLQRETYGKALLDMMGIDEEAIRAAVKSGKGYQIRKPQVDSDVSLSGGDSK